METIINAAPKLLSEEHYLHAVEVLKKGKTGTSLARQDYYIIKNVNIVALGWVEKITRQSSGIIRGVMARNQLESIKFCGLIEETVPDREMTLREIVRDQSICGGQGFKKCSCLRGNCRTSRCACFKSDLLCNSACHSRRSCENNDK